MKRLRFALLALAAMGAAPGAESAGAIYKAHCARCHGPTFDRGGGDIRSISDEKLVTITRDGRGRMPSFRDCLSEKEVRSLIAYIREVGQKGE